MVYASNGSRLSLPSGSETMAWCGAITPTSFIVMADVYNSGDVRVVVSRLSDVSSRDFVSDYQTPVVTTGSTLSYRSVNFTVTGLDPNTTYYYKFEFKDTPSNVGIIRSMKTAPAAKSASSFRFSVGSCSNLTGMVKNDIFRAIALDSPLFFMHIGDMTYADVATTNAGEQRTKISRQYRFFPGVDILNRTVPLTYIFDDHDVGINNVTLDDTNAETIMRNSRTVVRETTPIYPPVQLSLGETNLDRVTMTQVFDIGRARFIKPDCRSQRRLSTLKAMGNGKGPGDYWDQMTWLNQALIQAETDGMAYIFLVISSTWTGGTYAAYGDNYTAERQAICDMIENLNTPVCIISGDCHECAADSGENTGFSTSGFAFFPQIVSSGLVQPSPLTGAGPFTWNGAVNGKRYNVVAGMYTVLDITDNGTFTWAATFKGEPINPSTFAPATLGSVSSTDATPAVSFNNTTPTVARNVPLTIDLNKTWFGACSVQYATNTGLSGTVSVKPNRKRASFTVTFPNPGVYTLTLSTPVGCTISGGNPATVTVT